MSLIWDNNWSINKNKKIINVQLIYDCSHFSFSVIKWRHRLLCLLCSFWFPMWPFHPRFHLLNTLLYFLSLVFIRRLCLPWLAPVRAWPAWTPGALGLEPRAWSCAGSSASPLLSASSSLGFTTRLGTSPASSSPLARLSRGVTQPPACLSLEDARIKLLEMKCFHCF